MSCSAAAHEGAGGVDHVVDEHARAAVDLADHVAGLDRVARALDPALVHDGQVGVRGAGVALGHLHPAGVGRHDDEVVAEGRHVVDQHRHGREVVDRAVEEPLDLPECRSTLTMRSAPAAWNMSATSLAVMGSRPSALRSWRP